MGPSRVQTKREIEAMLRGAGVGPRRRLGQHFLVDGNLMRRLVECAEVGADDVVLEVGAGTGGLTDLLVARAGRVVAVEVDRALHGILRDRFSGAKNLRLLLADALATKNRVAPAVLEAVRQARESSTGELLLVSNLPYHIATPLVMNLLLESVGFARFCFTVQREVGCRIEAEPGGKDYGPVSVVLQATCAVRRVANVPASAFWPRPAVESAMYRVDVGERPFADAERFRGFVDLVRGAFLHRRKTLRHNLSRLLSGEECERAAAVVDFARRPEQVSPGEWVAIAECVGRGPTS